MSPCPVPPSLSDSDKNLLPVLESLQDVSLVRRMAEGDRGALASLFDRLAPSILGTLVHRIGRRDLADLVLEETFLAAWEQAAAFRPERATPRGWLLRLARLQTRRVLEGAPGSGLAPEAAQAPVGESREWSSASRALSGLPADQRECVELALHGGLSQSQIAERLGRSANTVKIRLQGAMTKLRRVLS